MTTTISKHDLQLQQQQQLLLLQHQPKQQQQPQQQQSSTALGKSPAVFNLSTNIYEKNVATFNNSITTATTTTKFLDGTATYIQIDSLNNNMTSMTPATVTITPVLTTPSNNNNGTMLGGLSSPDGPTEVSKTKRRSLLNFKSFDFNIKALYSGLRNGNKSTTAGQYRSSSIGGVGGIGSGSLPAETPNVPVNRMPPFLKIESVDTEESENLLLDYPQSPYSSRRNSSQDDDRTSSQMLHINRYDISRSQTSSPSPYFLTPYNTMNMGTGDVSGSTSGSGNIRRSSTSDIQSGKRSGTSSASDSRRPSTSDLLRRARERRSSEARMGRSVSQGGLSRGGFRSGGSGTGGGRRTSMAF